MDVLTIVKFISITFIVSIGIILFLKWQLFSSTEGAVKRLNDEIEIANKKQAELNEKMRKADEELKQRQAEAKELSDKIRNEAEVDSKEQRDTMIAKAREEGEEIIAKAQLATDKLRFELEKEMDMKAVKFAMEIMTRALSAKAKGALDSILIDEYIEKLKNTDMSRIGANVDVVDLITISAIDAELSTKIQGIIKEKIGRDIKINAVTDPNIGGGVVVKFGSMALDGSVANVLKEVAISMQEVIEDKKQ